MAPDSHLRLLLIDIGNTHCHCGIASPDRLLSRADIPTAKLLADNNGQTFAGFTRGVRFERAVLCGVVPKALRHAQRLLRDQLGLRLLILNHRSLRGVGLDYPRPETIGPDRLANAIAAIHWVGGPVVVVDFGTAVTFDIVDRRGRYIGGIIAPGLAAMTDYLHEKTALLPRIRIRDVKSAIGRSTEEAMLVGAVHGYRGLVRQLIQELRHDLGARRLPVIATGGYAQLIAQGVREITAVRPDLTLEGLRLFWAEHRRSEEQRSSVIRKARH